MPFPKPPLPPPPQKKKIERLERFCTAYQYKEARSTLAESDKKLQEMKELIQTQADQARERADAIKEKDAAMEALAQKRGGHMSESYNAAKATEEKVSKELVKLTAVWQNKNDSLKAERKALDEVSILNGFFPTRSCMRTLELLSS